MDLADPARLFIALWPDAACLGALQACADSLPWPPGARREPVGRLHLTLQFIGAVERAQLGKIADGLAVEAAPIGLTLNRLDRWKDGIAVLLPGAVPPELAELHTALAARLALLGIAADSRPYRPHVTLARKAADLRPGPVEPLPWKSQGYALMESRGGYHLVRKYG